MKKGLRLWMMSGIRGISWSLYSFRDRISRYQLLPRPPLCSIIEYPDDLGQIVETRFVSRKNEPPSSSFLNGSEDLQNSR